MGKKNNKKTIPALDNSGKQQDSAVIENEIQENKTAEVETKKVVSKETKQKDKKVKKEKKPSKIGRKFKETFSELKKVTWPTFPKVIKQTGVVLAVVVFFGLVLFAFDYVLKFLFKLMTEQETTATELWVTVGISSAIVLGGIVWLTIWLIKRNRKGNR